MQKLNLYFQRERFQQYPTLPSSNPGSASVHVSLCHNNYLVYKTWAKWRKAFETLNDEQFFKHLMVDGKKEINKYNLTVVEQCIGHFLVTFVNNSSKNPANLRKLVRIAGFRQLNFEKKMF